jgi:hypothetical protein
VNTRIHAVSSNQTQHVLSSETPSSPGRLIFNMLFNHIVKRCVMPAKKRLAIIKTIFYCFYNNFSDKKIRNLFPAVCVNNIGSDSEKNLTVTFPHCKIASGNLFCRNLYRFMNHPFREKEDLFHKSEAHINLVKTLISS